MRYRDLGKTGLAVSEIGLGCEGFVGADEALAERMFRLALDAGVNCMDLYTPDPAVNRFVGRMIGDRREQFVLQVHLCTRWKDGQYEAVRDLEEVKRAFSARLEQLGTDHADVGMIHYVDSADTWRQVLEGGIADYARQLKAEGKIRAIGMSSHNPIVAQEAVESGLIDVLMFSVNPCYDLQPGNEDIDLLFDEASYDKQLVNFDQDRVRLYETCQRLGVGITVMKAFGGGDLLTADSPAGVALTANQCLHYALTRPAVAAVMSGARSVEELEASLAYEDASDEERDYAAVFATFPRISWKGHCMYCGHCAPCPMGIDIAAVTKFLNLAKAQGSAPETVREHYKALDVHASECLRCGRCEGRCPFQVRVINNMRQAASLFGY